MSALTNILLVAVMLLVVAAAFPWLIVVALAALLFAGLLKTLKWAFT